MNKKLIIQIDRRTSTYKIKTAPCDSCNIHFDKFIPRTSRRRRSKKRSIRLPLFANCAEYDVIRSGKLDHLLRHAALNHWTQFEKAYAEHFNAFEDFKAKLRSSEHSPESLIKEYYHRTANAKILKYKMIGEIDKEPHFELCT